MKQERKRILELVQSGKITAQEAIVLLEALESEVKDGTEQKEEAKTQPHGGASSEKQSEQFDKGQTTTNQKTKNENDDSLYSQLENVGEKIFDFVSNAFNKLKDIETQFTQPIDIPHTFQQTDELLEAIDIDIANGPVKIVAWDQPDVRVECQAKVYRTENREQARQYFIENTIFTMKDNKLYFSTQSKWMRVETVVYVPKKQYQNVKVKLFNGGLTGDQLNVDHLQAKTTNGKIEFNHLEANHIDVETVNGQIRLNEFRSEKLEVETVNGAIHVTGNFKDADLQTFNGNIECVVHELNTQIVEAKAVTGNIQLYLPNTASIDGDIRSNLGNYQIDLDGIQVMHEKKEVIQKQVQFKKEGTSEQAMKVHVDTKTGTVFLRNLE